MITLLNTRDGSRMIMIPSGRFLAGRDEGDSGDKAFPVNLPAYYLAETEVTNAQYARFLMETRPSQTDLDSWISLDGSCFVREAGTEYEAYGGKANHPVVQVSWFGAVAYCEWAGLRLPTELEWEKAARGTDGRTYPWGNSWDATKCRNSHTRGSETTAEVGAYPSGDSCYGLADMAGNVWEWCADWYDRGAYIRYKTGNLKPPVSGSARVLRGGAWNYGLKYRFCCAYRNALAPMFRLEERYGFRCAGTF